ncbi:tRNA lysidine(34) synthetase TilS [Ferribacterium limneticum]|uniref:tRNA lysidine(34) synthetase TilS n=1 Tax=Ferribacterium limneticum TaxID=76259 RepID=UPI001CF8AF93|nr:tRNA lysidine(34) synthetase TilS [Ferribacterium limneticum]UCV23874.1 tRNA lysidine(34) synthetase TilS [Ferribacterium limneticum]
MAATRNSLSADLRERVGVFLATRLQPDTHLWVGLSGGCDSVVLLHVLSRLGLGRLSAIHVHHALSPNADAWAEFCAGYCKRLGVPLTIRHVAVDTSSGLGLEAAARAARYAAFAECTGGSLLLAQHRGDQAETVLLNLLRGTGVTGAAGMPVERQFGCLRLLRPLLDVSRAEIESYASAEGLAWITDESNADTSLTRNFLRHEVLAAISQRFPSAETSLAQAASHFAEAAGLLDDLAAHDWQLLSEGDAVHMRALRQLSLPRLKNLLRHRLRRLGWQVPVTSRLEEFARQLQSAAPDRHPELVLPDGKMRVARGLLHWLSEK